MVAKIGGVAPEQNAILESKLGCPLLVIVTVKEYGIYATQGSDCGIKV